MLTANCVREEEKAAELELRSRLFSFGQFNSDAQVSILRLWFYFYFYLMTKAENHLGMILSVRNSLLAQPLESMQTGTGVL